MIVKVCFSSTTAGTVVLLVVLGIFSLSLGILARVHTYTVTIHCSVHCEAIDCRQHQQQHY